MDDKILCNKLAGVTALKKDRTEVALWVLGEPDRLPALIRLGMAPAGELSVKACWVMDIVARENIGAFLPYTKLFVSGIETVTSQSAIRPIARICEQLVTVYDGNKRPLHLSFDDKELETLVRAGFNWLLGANKVATRAYAMGSLFLLGKAFPWIHEELETILHRGYLHESAGFRARARMVLANIQRYRARASDGD